MTSSWSPLLSVVGALVWSAPAFAAPPAPYVDLCPRRADGSRSCDVKIRVDGSGAPIHSDATPVGGYAPADLQSAYGLPAGGGAGKLVAVYGGNSDYPQAESDLGVYRAQYGLPACTAANGCFLRVDEHGGTGYPPAGTNEVEQALDMEMVSASCPACRIMLIEGGDMDVALATVIAHGGSAFSFSVLLGYGGSTGSLCTSMGFDQTSGLLVTAALGDTNYPGARDYMPAACQGTLAVGGTTLNKASNGRGWSETTWSGTGSGCSAFVAKPSWQNDTGCTMRMEGDVAMVADPGTGVSVYGTLGAGGWFVVGGTSAAAPLTAGSLTALGIADGHFAPAWVWQNSVNFYDITTGTNGPCAGEPAYFCNAQVGYDGPTGWGTVNGNLLKTALPPGSTTGGTCATPTGSYGLSCTNCVAGMRIPGCTLVCQSCTKIDGTQNLGPTLALPCDGTIENDDGVLRCIAAPDAGDALDAGSDAGESGDATTKSPDAGSKDAAAPHEGGAGNDASLAASKDAGGDSPGNEDPTSPSRSSSGCGCAAAGHDATAGSTALALGMVLVWGRRRRQRRVTVRAARPSAGAQRASARGARS